MKHNVNFFLFGIIIILLGAMVGLALYFNSTYEGLNSQYEKALRNLENLSCELNITLQELNEKNKALTEKEKTLIDIFNELNLTEQKVSSLGDFYSQEKGVREELEEDLSKTEEERDFWKLNYTQTKQDLDLWKKNYQIKVKELNKATDRISLLENIVDNIDREVTGTEGIDKIADDLVKILDIIEEDLDDLDDIIREEVQGEYAEQALNEKAGDLEDSADNLKTKINKLRASINEIKSSLDRA